MPAARKRIVIHCVQGVIIPQLAMSAATMIACAADEIVLGKHSFLGPIDPQLILNTPVGQRMVPAENILEQFEQGQKRVSRSRKAGSMASDAQSVRSRSAGKLPECKSPINEAGPGLARDVDVQRGSQSQDTSKADRRLVVRP